MLKPITCGICDVRISHEHNGRCERCRLLEKQIHAAPELARKILGQLDPAPVCASVAAQLREWADGAPPSRAEWLGIRAGMRDIANDLDAPAVSAPAPKPKKPRAKKDAEQAAHWSDGARAFSRAVRRTKTYDALHPDKLSRAVARELDKSDPVVPPQGFRAKFFFTCPDAHKKAAELLALGVPASAIQYETAEEVAKQARREKIAHYHRDPSYLAPRPDQLCYASSPAVWTKRHADALELARECLAAGERWETRDVLGMVRHGRRVVSAHFSALENA